MKTLIIFDLDGTLTESKSDLDGEMATLLARLLGTVDVAIISGGAWSMKTLGARKPPLLAWTSWWGTQSRQTGLH
jgi:hypothetical protein